MKVITVIALFILVVLIAPLRSQVQVTTDEWYKKTEDFSINQASLGGKVIGDKAKTDIDLNKDLDVNLGVRSVGISPRGYGKFYHWDRKESQVTLVTYINPADHLGVAVTNLQPGDIIEITSATGISSFSDGNGRLISSLIGAVATSGEVFAPEAGPFIRIGENFAKASFAVGNRGKQRDVFGVDDKGKYQKCEGGILIAMPSAGGVYYSTEGCLKEKLPRTEDMKPNHVQHGFFLTRPQNNEDQNWRRVIVPGEMYILAWDRKFTDNQGYYMLMLRITQSEQGKE